MHALLIPTPVQDPVWTGLGPDVEGLCAKCGYKRTLAIQHIPTNDWICRKCFNALWAEEA